jgi:hypothetical protein
MGIEILAKYSQSEVRRAVKTVTFDGTAGKGAVGTVACFTVTGDVLIMLASAKCITDLTEAAATASITWGITGSTALFAPNPTGGATDLDAGEFWVDATPNLYGVAVPAAQKDIEINQNIILTIATQAVNGGSLRMVILWAALSDDGNVVAA